MNKATIDGITVTTDFDCSLDEMENYVNYVRERVKEPVHSITVTTCDDGLVDVNYNAHAIPFERIRRITGYLVGDLTRWNDSKQAEERDRLKHDTRF